MDSSAASSPLPAPQKKYGDVSWGGLAQLTTVLARFPIISLWFLARNALFRRQPQSLRQSFAAALIRWSSEVVPEVGQLQYMIPQALDAYKSWAAANSLPVTIENLANDGTILWIGPKRTDRVILYFPGGAYYAPILKGGMDFLLYLQLELLKNDCDIGIAVVSYSLLPAVFPTQIHQAMLATEHIIASGVHPRNLHLMGDSAGGNVIMGLLSHMLHPLEGIRPMIRPKAPFASLYLMSPWVCLDSSSEPITNDHDGDVLSGVGITRVGRKFLEAVPAHQRPYVEPLNAPDGWFNGLDSIVGRMLVTAGGVELFRDDIAKFSEIVGKSKSQYTYFVQANGFHDDPLIRFMTGEPLDQLGEMPELIVQWLAASIKTADSA